MTRRQRRPSRILAVLVGLALVMSGCSKLGGGESSSPSPSQGAGQPPAGEPEANGAGAALAKALSTGKLDGVGVVGDPATATKNAAADLTTIMAGMDGLKPEVKPSPISYLGSGVATVELQQKYTIGAKAWEFTSKASLNLIDEQWKVVWKPEIVHPQLGPTTRLRHTREVPDRAPILDRSGKSVMWAQDLHDVGIDKQNLPKAQWTSSATDLAKALKIDPAGYVKKVNAAGASAFVLAASVRPAQLPSSLITIPGAMSIKRKATLALSPTFADSILGSVGPAEAKDVKEPQGPLEVGEAIGRTGLQKRYDTQLRGAVGHTITMVKRRGVNDDNHADAVLHSDEPTKGKPLTLTLDIARQNKAESVLKGVKPVASLVAIDLKTGQVLAAANSPASKANPDATFGRYAPGSTFKMVTALAMVRQGMSAQTRVSCPARATVNGRVFENYDDYPTNKLGTITLAEAIAHSCNTTFILQAAKLPKDAMASAAASLGFGVDFDAGFPVFYGSVPATADPVVAAANTIGQGKVEGSPLAVAALAASVGRGQTTVPSLIQGTAPRPGAEPLTANETAQLQAMMKTTVSQGSGRSLAGLVTGAKTGTAEFMSGKTLKTRAWMMVYTKDVAVAVLVAEGASGSRDAAPIIKAFLS